jgi:hypothetical protein
MERSQAVAPHGVGTQISGLFGYVWPSEVLATSVGDLIFAISSSGFSNAHGWDTLAILIPPEFRNILPEQVVSTITNNYANIFVRSLSAFDRFGPRWTIVSVTADANTRHQFINFTTGTEWYYVRVNGVIAPSIAGNYFFKMYLFSSLGENAGELPSGWIPTQNWPTFLVKGEVDPASITGTIRYGSYNSSLNGAPIQEAGLVWAHMATKLDPVSGERLYSCPSPPQPPRSGCFDAAAYFNATVNGQYDMEGVAAGIYDIYAEAAGYGTEIVKSGVTLLRGQSLRLDGYLNPGVVIRGDVYSKHQMGDEPWPESSYIKIELYDKPTNSHMPDPSANLVSWSPLPCIAGGQTSYVGGSHAGSCGDPRLGSSVAFPWHEYRTYNGYSSNGVSDTNYGDNTSDPQGVGPPQHWFVKGGSADPFHFQFGSRGEYGAPKDLDGHVPQIYATWINGLTPGKYYLRAWVFRYAQTGFDGSALQEYPFVVTANEWAGDVSVPIDLRLSSWINETVYFHNLQGVLTTSTVNTGAGYLYGALEDTSGARWAFNVTSLGFTNSTGTYRHSGYSTVMKKQLGTGDPNDPSGANSNSLQTGRAVIQFWGINDTWNGENYGIPSGIYNSVLWATGYLQSTPTQASVTLSGNPTSIGDHLFRGGGFDLRIQSIDWEMPAVARNWVWNGQEIDIAIYRNNLFVDVLGEQPSFMANVALGGGCTKFGNRQLCSGSNLFQNSATNSVNANGGGQNFQPNDNADWAFFGEEGEYQNVGGYTDFVLARFNVIFKPLFTYLPTAFPAGQYDFRAWTYGYVQANYSSAYAQPGQVANVNINLIISVSLSLDMGFRQERILARLPADTSARVRFFDQSGTLVAEWMSSEGVYVTGPGTVKAADGTSSAAFGAGDSLGPDPTSMNYLPAGTTLLHVATAGLPLVPPTGSRITHLYYGDPVFGTSTPLKRKMGGIDFGVDEMRYPYFLNAGILGSPYYTGGWTVEVDMVNLRQNSVSYYPPPDGLLLGESYHVIPSTKASSGVSFTEDAAISGIFIGHSMLANHLGPYSQVAIDFLAGPPSGGSSSGAFEIYIGQSASQIPEFQTIGLVLLLTLMTSLYLLKRKRTRTTPVACLFAWVVHSTHNSGLIRCRLCA